MTQAPSKGLIIGAGYFAQFQAEAWQRIAEAAILAVVDPVPGKAKTFADRYGIPRAYESVETALDRERPDFVDIATRPESHLDLTRLAASRGVHVICQKPMAPTWEECVEMVNVCESAGVRLLMHENWRWQPWYREIKRLLDEDVFGQPFQLSFLLRTGDGRGGEPYTVQPYFRQMPKLLIYETLVHFLDTFRFLAGGITSVYCRTARINPIIRGEDQALVQMTFASGAQGLLDANRISGPVPTEVTMGRFRLEGERAMIRLSPDGRLWLTEYGHAEREHPFPTTEAGYKGDSVHATQRHLIDCLRSGRASESDGRDYLQTVAAVFACYRSAETGQGVELR
jgi:predicted dehydrogenase